MNISKIYYVLLFLILSRTADSFPTHLARNLQYSTSAADWRTCLQGSTKWCRFGTSKIEGECCTLGSTSGRCSGTGSYICSNNVNIDTEAGYGLCPGDSTNWGRYDINLNYVGDSETRGEIAIASNTVCVFKIDVSSGFVKNVKIKIGNHIFIKHFWINLYFLIAFLLICWKVFLLS